MFAKTGTDHSEGTYREARFINLWDYEPNSSSPSSPPTNLQVILAFPRRKSMAGVVPAGTSKIRIKFLADNYTENYFG
jgi:hypothetical protein